MTAAARGAAGYLYRNRARSKQREAQRAAEDLRRERAKKAGTLDGARRAGHFGPG